MDSSTAPPPSGAHGRARYGPRPGGTAWADSTVPAHAVRNGYTVSATLARPAGPALDDVVFVVVDLETTGLSPETSRITEVAALRMRGWDVLAQFATLVAPGVPVPAVVTALTGISDDLLAGAPAPSTVLPAFLDFARGGVLVAHNAPFDVAFLRAACAACGRRWPGPDVVDTLTLARALLAPGEVADFRLPTLATALGAPEPPAHRAVSDARATAFVLRSLLARVHLRGVHDLDGLLGFLSEADPNGAHPGG